MKSASEALETTSVLLTSAVHKGAYWIDHVPIIDPLVRPVVIPVPKGWAEPDVSDPAWCATGKLRSFASRPGVIAKLEKEHAGAGPLLAIAMLAEQLHPATLGKRPVTIHCYNTMGSAKMTSLREYRGSPPDKYIRAAWQELALTMSPGMIHLLGNKSELKRLYSGGYIGDGVFNSGSVGGIDWVRFVLGLPDICALKKDDDLWMDAEGDGEFYHVDSQLDDVEGVHSLLNEFLRGIAHGVMREILAN